MSEGCPERAVSRLGALRTALVDRNIGRRLDPASLGKPSSNQTGSFFKRTPMIVLDCVRLRFPDFSLPVAGLARLVSHLLLFGALVCVSSSSCEFLCPCLSLGTWARSLPCASRVVWSRLFHVGGSLPQVLGSVGCLHGGSVFLRALHALVVFPLGLSSTSRVHCVSAFCDP